LPKVDQDGPGIRFAYLNRNHQRNRRMDTAAAGAEKVSRPAQKPYAVKEITRNVILFKPKKSQIASGNQDSDAVVKAYERDVENISPWCPLPVKPTAPGEVPPYRAHEKPSDPVLGMIPATTTTNAPSARRSRFFERQSGIRKPVTWRIALRRDAGRDGKRHRQRKRNESHGTTGDQIERNLWRRSREAGVSISGPTRGRISCGFRSRGENCV